MGNFKEEIKAFVGMQHSNRYVITAAEARAKSIYGSAGKRERYITDKIELFSQKIKEATESRKFAIVEKLELDYGDVLPDVIQYFKGEGFGVKIIDSTDIPELYDDRYIVIAWKELETKEDEELSSNLEGGREDLLDLPIDGGVRHPDSQG